MLRVASVGSGSKGNATLVASEETTLLIDCGFPAREMLSRLDQINVCLLYTSPSPRDVEESRMPSSA